MESSATRHFNVYITLSTLFFIMNSSDLLPIDRWPPECQLENVFVSESVTPRHAFLEARGPTPARIPAPTEKTAFLGGYTSPHHVPHLLSVLPLVWRPSWPGDHSHSNDSFFFPVSESILHDYFVSTVESKDLD